MAARWLRPGGPAAAARQESELNMTTGGIISDTHGRLQPEALAALAESDHIIPVSYTHLDVYKRQG